MNFNLYDQSISASLHNSMKHAMEYLSKEEMVVSMLYYLYSFSAKDIAELKNKSEHEIERILFSARSKRLNECALFRKESKNRKETSLLKSESSKVIWRRAIEKIESVYMNREQKSC